MMMKTRSLLPKSQANTACNSFNANARRISDPKSSLDTSTIFRRPIEEIFTALCSPQRLTFRRRARDGFRLKAGEFGFSEVHLWGKGEIEDQLFQPKNDHLLFAYFGVSLHARRRTLKTQVRARLAAKRKAKRVLTPHGAVLVRDATDERYPDLDADTSLDRITRGRWQVYKFDECRSDGVHFRLRRHAAFIDYDGEHWDYDELMNDARVTHENPWSSSSEDEAAWEARTAAMQIWSALPDQNKAWFEVFIVLPYENIVDIDDAGDECFRGPQIYTTEFHPVDGPFRNYCRATLETTDHSPRIGDPDEAKRIEKFPRRKKETSR
jgi:hypothetical protein